MTQRRTAFIVAAGIWQYVSKRTTVMEQRADILHCVASCQRSRKIRLSTSSRNGHIRERLEVLRLVGGDDACVAREYIRKRPVKDGGLEKVTQ